MSGVRAEGRFHCRPRRPMPLRGTHGRRFIHPGDGLPLARAAPSGMLPVVFPNHRQEPDAVSKVKVGLIGTGFVADLHAAASKMVPDLELVAVASPTPGKAAHFAKERGIPHAF